MRHCYTPCVCPCHGCCASTRCITHSVYAHAMVAAPQPVALHTVCMPMPCSNPLQVLTCAISVVSANSLTKSAPRLHSRQWRRCELNIYEKMCFFRANELRNCVLCGGSFESLKACLAASSHLLTRSQISVPRLHHSARRLLRRNAVVWPRLAKHAARSFLQRHWANAVGQPLPSRFVWRVF
jgi:hypothetical protein